MTDAKPTPYGGHTMRSRLEADWALTFDSLGIAWQYEPQLITLGTGTRYLPDFWLPELGTWIEVKGDGVPRVAKAYQLGRDRTCRCKGDCTCRWPGGELVLVGHPPTHCTDRTHRAWRRGGHMNWSTAHGGRAWIARCGHCQSVGWVLATLPLQCRKCGRRPNGHLFSPGDAELLFARADGVPDRRPPEATS